MNKSRNPTQHDGTESNTLAHELVAREEYNISVFFASFAIQFYMNRDMLRHELAMPAFLKNYEDIEIFASQRVLIKNIIISNNLRDVNNEMYRIYKEKSDLEPGKLFLSKINKAFLIRQVFGQTDQVLSKFHFIDMFLNLDISHLDINELNDNMEELNAQEKIIVLARVFTQMHDRFENKKKTLRSSFIENIQRKQQEYKIKDKADSPEFANLNLLLEYVTK